MSSENKFHYQLLIIIFFQQLDRIAAECNFKQEEITEMIVLMDMLTLYFSNRHAELRNLQKVLSERREQFPPRKVQVMPTSGVSM